MQGKGGGMRGKKRYERKERTMCRGSFHSPAGVENVMRRRTTDRRAVISNVRASCSSTGAGSVVQRRVTSEPSVVQRKGTSEPFSYGALL